MMHGPEGHLVHAATEKKPAKFGKTFEDAGGRLDIWYTEATKPDESGFGAIVEARALALEMVKKTLDALQGPDDIARKALAAHFGKLDATADSGALKLVRERFARILDGLSQPLVICLARSGKMNARGLTTKKDRIHLNLDILGNARQALARTIVHEASHAFAGIPGDTVEDGHATFEVYAHNDSYKKQCADVAIDCADSYAWAALSIHKGHVAQPWTSDEPEKGFHNEFGCLNCM